MILDVLEGRQGVESLLTRVDHEPLVRFGACVAVTSLVTRRKAAAVLGEESCKRLPAHVPAERHPRVLVRVGV